MGNIFRKNMKQVLLIGSGTREHAIAKALLKNKNLELICFASHQNPGIEVIAKKLQLLDFNDPMIVLDAVKSLSIDFAIIGPEAPLQAGVSDALMSQGISVIGPTKKLAQIETSKSFCRRLMQECAPHALPYFKGVHSITELQKVMEKLQYKFVIKADGLMGGKGVFVAGEHFESPAQAIDICQNIFDKGQSCLIEEQLVGEEFSLLSFCDGHTLSHMPIVQDNKRAFVGDTGPNTGGMGSISYPDHSLPFLSKANLINAQLINQVAVNHLQQEIGQSYKGILYGGYMLTKTGIKLIEFNARFGDPECINLLGLLETDFADICQAMIDGNVNEMDISFAEKASVCKYVVPNGYPDNPIKNETLRFDMDVPSMYCGHIEKSNNEFLMLGSRAVASLGVAASMAIAENIAEMAVKDIEGFVFHRHDIGSKKLLQKKALRMKEIDESAI